MICSKRYRQCYLVVPVSYFFPLQLQHQALNLSRDHFSALGSFACKGSWPFLLRLFGGPSESLQPNSACGVCLRLSMSLRKGLQADSEDELMRMQVSHAHVHEHPLMVLRP